MLSASVVTGDGKYFTDLARDEYYTKGGEPPGRWLGSGAVHFALDCKKVHRDALKSLLRGFSPLDHETKLVQNAGKPTRQSGLDFTFSAPKSVSVLWAAAPQEVQQEIQKCQAEAVRAGIEYLERNAAYTRRGKQGSEVEHAKLVVATFEHATSRAGDPHLHTHCVIANACVRSDGTTGTLYGRVVKDDEGRILDVESPLFDHKMAAGAIYRAELAAQLARRLGVQLSMDDNGFSFVIEGIAKEACEHYSKRREKIEEQLRQVGFETAEAAEIATLSTRTEKAEVSRPKLFEEWKEELKAFGVTTETLKEVTGKMLATSYTREDSALALREAAEELAGEMGSFPVRELHRELANLLQTQGVSAKEIETLVQEEIVSGELVSLGEEKLSRVLSTQGVLKGEWEYSSLVQQSASDPHHRLENSTLRTVFRENEESTTEHTLSEEQRFAVSYLTQGLTRRGEVAGGVRVLTGDAGTGKTTVLRTAKTAWEKEGCRVVGAALAGRAVLELENSSGIESFTVAKWLHDNAKAASEPHRDSADQKKTPQLDANTVLVIDEAAMVETPSLYRLASLARAKGTLVCLVGDEKQCQAIGHGGAFTVTSRAVPGERLTEVWRQKQAEDVEVAVNLASGKADLALRSLAERGRVHVRATEREAMEELVSRWKEQGVRDPAENQVLVGTHEQRRSLNEMLQAERLGAVQRTLGAAVTNHEGQKLYAGDRVHFRESLHFYRDAETVGEVVEDFAKNTWLKKQVSRREQINRGQFGTVLSINPFAKCIRVAMDDGRTLDVPLEVMTRPEEGRPPLFKAIRKAEIALGYAVTTHAAQGSTFENIYVLAGGPAQDRELSYVQFSRASEKTELFTSEGEAGAELTLLSLRSKAELERDDQQQEEYDKKLKHVFEGKESLKQCHLTRVMSRTRRKVFGLDREKEVANEEQEKERSLELER
ncbi:MAG: relaxase domain-containing protein [Pirellulales bacterium]|nr:relaxase domain-containing protein [Pirellulales bacterium]